MEFRDGLDLLVARRRRGLKQWQLAFLLGVSSTIVCDLENGRRNISPEMRERLTRALETPEVPAWLALR